MLHQEFDTYCRISQSPMNAKLILITLLVLTTMDAKYSFGQTQFDVPENIVLKTQDDYTKYESAIIEAAKWLEENDLNKEPDKRQQVIDFVIRWLEGSTAVTLELTEPIAKLYDKNDPLLGVFLVSYARNALENKGSPNKFNATKAAVTSIMTVYKKGIGITKNKQMEKAMKMANENKLDDFIVEVLRVEKD